MLKHAYERENQPDLRISGGSYTIKTGDEGEVKEIILKDKAGNIIPDGQSFTVGLNSYIAASYKFEHKDPGTSLYVTSAETIIDYIKQQGILNYQGERRVMLD